MKTKMMVWTVAILMLVCSSAYAFDSDRGPGSHRKASRQALLSQLSSEKEMLFHQTMRGVREKGTELRTQIKEHREALKTILTADTFDEELFRKKSERLETLHSQLHANREEAIVNLAKQFTADERAILVQLLPGKKGHGRRMSSHRGQ
jgi:uncharacterized membrane protein